MENNNAKYIAKVVCRIAAMGALLLIPRVVHFEHVASEHERESAGYYDAVRAIMNASMFASDKRAIIAVMKRNGSREYYRTVVSIVESSMFASDKLATIKALH